MAESADNQVGELQQRGHSCFMIGSVVAERNHGRPSPTNRRRQDQETPGQFKCNSKVKHLLLSLGFVCIIICFILASIGYMKLKKCPSDTRCEQNSALFSEAQNFRLTAALLFIVGICLIIVFVWTIKRENVQTTVVVQDVMVSNVTAEGLLKTPAPELPHPYSQVHHLVYEASASERAMDSSNLPNYEAAVDLLNTVNNERMSSVNGSGEIINVKGVEMESVCIQADEDDIDPPPSYLQALELENENQEPEERDTG